MALTWRKRTYRSLIFLGTFFVNLAIVSLILVKLPADHFSKNARQSSGRDRDPALHAAKVIGKNIAGVLLVALGVVLSLPGVPGQGLLDSASRYHVARFSGHDIVWNRSC